MAVEFKEKLAIGPSNVVDTAGAAVKVANKYSYMANAKTETVGAADGEFGCWLPGVDKSQPLQCLFPFLRFTFFGPTLIGCLDLLQMRGTTEAGRD